MALNFFAGDLAGSDAGVLSIPDRAQEFADNIDVAVGIGGRLGVQVFNALYGNRVTGVTPEQQDEIATQQLVDASTAAARIGTTVVVEPVSGPRPYPLRAAGDAMAVVDRVRAAGCANVGFLCDLYHLRPNGDDIGAAISAVAAAVAHVQIADVPGRHEPGTGTLEFDLYLDQLEELGYRGWLSLEYKPSTTTDDSLAWLPRCRRGCRDPFVTRDGSRGETTLTARLMINREVGVQAARYPRATSFEPSGQAFDAGVASADTL